MEKKELIKEIEKARERDFKFKDSHILGSMCTSPHPIGKKIYSKFIETNLGDPELFPGTKELERKAIEFVAKLLHAPSGYAASMTSGGTESNITAMWIFREASNKNVVVLPKHAHFSFEKALRMLKMKGVYVEGKYNMAAKDFKKAVSKETCCGVAIAGNTTYGYIDEIEEIADFCYDEHIFLHVDAAFGGFVIPFLKNAPKFDFSLKGVSSIAIDAHKMGLSPIPAGFLIMRKNWLDLIKVRSKCTHTRWQAGLLGTRPGAAAAAAYAVMHYIGMDGYKKVVKKCMDNVAYLKKLLDENGIEYVPPRLNVVAIKCDAERVAMELKRRGWMVGLDESEGVIRLVIMPHVKKKFIAEFIEDLKKVIK